MSKQVKKGYVRIGVVTITYNSESVIDDFLLSCVNQEYKNFKLYIIDNNSADQTLNKINEYKAKLEIEIVKNPENIGFAGGANIGINRALSDACDYILLVNNDTEFSSNIFYELFTAMEFTDADAVSPKILHRDQSSNCDRIWYAGGGFLSSHRYKVQHFRANTINCEPHDQLSPLKCDFAPMCFVMFTSSCFGRFGLLDEKFFVYSEDADWFYRAKPKGIKLYYIPTSSILHKVSTLTGGEYSRVSLYHGTKNKVYLIRKNFKGLTRIKYLIEYTAWIFIGLIIGKFSFNQVKVKLKGWVDGVKLRIE